MPSPYLADGWDAWKTEPEVIETGMYERGVNTLPDFTAMEASRREARDARLIKNFWNSVKTTMKEE